MGWGGGGGEGGGGDGVRTHANSKGQRWEWREVRKPESGGLGAAEGPRWGPMSLPQVGGQGVRPLKLKAFSKSKV